MSLDDRPAARSAADEAETGAVRPFPQRPDAPAPTAVQPVPQAPKKGSVRKRILFAIIALVVLGLAGRYGYDYWTVGRFMVKTDDAYIQADIAQVSPKIQGYAQEIPVVENQRVKAGDELVRLDDGDYRIELETARSKIGTERETLKRIDAEVEAAKASVLQAEAQKKADAAAQRNAQLTADRTRNLVERKVAAQSQLDQDEADLDQAIANQAGADAMIASAKANVAVLGAERSEAASLMRGLELAVDQAKRNLDLTVLHAPFDGIVSNIAIEQGDLVTPGQRIAAIVPSEKLYIEANYKETQLADIAPGAKVRVSVDALPGQTFEGTVTSISAATGSLFSLLPAQNATGNFTKVVQRVPVRISLPADAIAAGHLRAGLSVITEVDSRSLPDAAGR